MKNIKDFNQKYAFNINNIRKEKSLKEVTENGKGFYDSIMKKDNKIKIGKIKLKKLKSNSVKELIYSNKTIPEHWKNKINYHQEILNILFKDDKFLSYIGRGKNSPLDFESKENKSKSNPIKNELTFNYLYKNNNKNNLENVNKNSQSSININKLTSKKTNSTFSINGSDDNHNSNFIRQKFFQRMKKEYKDKEIINILEDLRTAFPIKQHFDMIIKNEETKRNKHIFSKSFSNNLSIKSINISKDNINNLSMFNTKNINIPQRKKIKALKESVYNNIMLVKIKNNIEKLNSTFEKKQDELYKTIDIINPIIKKKLEHINYFGPFNNFCIYCRKRNIDFYNKLEHNRCLKLIHYLKKSKGNQFLNKTNQDKINKKLLNHSSIT